MGVRPTKIAMRKLEEGMTQETFVPWFQKENLVSEEKAHLAWQIAGREKKLLDQLDYENGYSLYVGIPFCPTVCSYCSFSSGALGDWEHRVEDYLAALMKELEAIAKISEGRKADHHHHWSGNVPQEPRVRSGWRQHRRFAAWY